MPTSPEVAAILNGLSLSTAANFSAKDVAIEVDVNVSKGERYAGLVARYSGPGDQTY